MAKTVNLTEGSVFKSIITFTIPVFLTLVLQMAYNTADLVIVGQFASVGDVSAVTIGGQITYAVTAVFTGISMGTTILIGRYIGAHESEKTSHVVGVSVAMFVVVAVITSIIMALSCNLLATVLRTPAESFAQTSSYLFITGAGSIFIVFYNLVGSVFRGIGDSKTPLLTVAIACVINILLDLLFIKQFGMGSAGAALATVIAQGVSVVLSVWLMTKREMPFTVHREDFCFDFKLMGTIVKLGLPIALQGLLCSLSFLGITSIVNGFGVIASAATGIAGKVTGLVMLVPSAFMQSLSAYTAQNYGARKIERAKQAMLWAMLISGIVGIMTAYVVAFHGTLLTSIFTQDPEITATTLLCMQAYAVDCFFVGASFAFSGYFSGYGKTTFVMTQTMIGSFAVRLPLAYFFSTMPNTNMFWICLSSPAATALQILINVVFYWYMKHRENRFGTYSA